MDYSCSLVVASTKAAVPTVLNAAIAKVYREAMASRGAFTIALSGGSLPAFLSTMKESLSEAGVESIQYQDCYVLLADERCVPMDDPDSNLGALQQHFLANFPIPDANIYGINQDLLKPPSTTADVAVDYEGVLRNVLEKTGGCLDLAVLGFGPDGHTCSLFPGHPLLEENSKWVAPIVDSPKPPPERITLTFPVLNGQTRHVIVCGAGNSKAPIIQGIFTQFTTETSDNQKTIFQATMATPSPYPSGMVRPKTADGTANTLTWIVDVDAMQGIATA